MKAKHKIWLVVLITSALAGTLRFTLGSPIDKKAEEDAFWVQKTYDKNHYNVLILGDSRVYRSINPAIIEREIPQLKVKNLGYSALGFDKYYLESARAQLSDNGPIKIFVIGLSPRSISTRAKENESFKEWKDKTKFEVWKMRDLAIINNFFCTYTPSELFVRFIKGKAIQNYVFQDFNSDGFVKSMQVPFSIEEGLATYKNEIASSTLNQNAIEDLLSFIEKCQNENIHVLFYRPPTMDRMEEIENALPGYSETNLAEIFMERGAMLWEPTSACATYDASHVDFMSADKLSHELALFLQLKFPSIRQGNK